MRRIALLSTVALLAACGSSSSPTPQGFLRVGNLSPDLLPLDFCVRVTGTTTWSEPVMLTAGATAGLVYDGGTGIDGALQVSRYFEYAAGTYDVAVFQKGLLGSTCANPIASKTGIVLDGGAHKLLAAVGFTGSTTAPHALVSFTDETTVTTGNVAIRFANVAILPGATFAEKAGTFENWKHQLQAFEQAIPVIEMAKSEGQIATDLLAVLAGKPAPIDTEIPIVVDTTRGQVAAGLQIATSYAETFNAASIRTQMASAIPALAMFATDVQIPAGIPAAEPDMQIVDL